MTEQNIATGSYSRSFVMHYLTLFVLHYEKERRLLPITVCRQIEKETQIKHIQEIYQNNDLNRIDFLGFEIDFKFKKRCFQNY